MKEKLITALTTKFEGVDAKILDRIATKLAKTTTQEEDVQTAVDGVSFQDLLNSFGDARANEASKTAVANYEKKFGLKDGKLVEKPTETEPKPSNPLDDPSIPAWAQALIQGQKAMQQQFETMNAEKVGNTRKARIEEMLKDSSDSVRKMYDGMFANMSFADDAAFDTWIEGQKPIVQSLANDMKAKGAVVHKPMGSAASAQGEVNPALKAMVDAQQNAPQPGASIMGMPTAPGK